MGVLAVPTAVLALVTFSGGGVVTFLPIDRPDGRAAGIALLGFGVASSLARWRVGRWADRVGTAVLLPASIAVTAVGLAAVGGTLLAGSSTALLVVAATVCGLGYGAVQNLTLVVAFHRAGPENAGTASAAWNAAFDTGTAVGALAVGVVAGFGIGIPGTYLLCAAAVGGTALVVGSSARWQRPGLGGSIRT